MRNDAYNYTYTERVYDCNNEIIAEKQIEFEGIRGDYDNYVNNWTALANNDETYKIDENRFVSDKEIILISKIGDFKIERVLYLAIN